MKWQLRAPLMAGCLLSLAVLAGCQLSSPRTGNETIAQEPIQALGHTLPPQQAATDSSTTTESLPNQFVASTNTAWVNTIDSSFSTARALVEDRLNVDLDHILLLVVDNKPINDEVARETRRLVNAQFGVSDFSDHFLSEVMQAQAGTFAALFTSRLNAVMVSRSMLAVYERSLPDDAAIRSAALLALLVHELVHAADDLRYGIHENRALNFRASFAQSATFEGHAQWVTRQICATNDCLIGLDALDNFMFSRDAKPSPHSQPVEAISRNVLEYSYVEGERFIDSLAQRPNGDQLIDHLLSSPPHDPIQILAPDSFPDNEREARNQRLIRASRDIDHPWVSGNWVSVETSPLKGVNLRADPSRRQAAVDGFTRLIQGMVAMQLYDRTAPENNPIEVTLLHAESARTARLFARTLHENTQLPGTTSSDEPLKIRTGAGYSQSDMRTHVYHTAVNDSLSYRTSILVSGPYVVQIAGSVPARDRLDDFAIRALLNLQLDHL